MYTNWWQCTYKITHISAAINLILFFFYSKTLFIMLFDMVPSLLLLVNWKLRYESLCTYTPLIFLYFSLISYVFININENLYLICYKLDRFGKHVVSMHWLKISFGAIGHLTTEIWVILEVHPLDFSAIFHSFLLVSLKFMNIYDKYFSYYTLC